MKFENILRSEICFIICSAFYFYFHSLWRVNSLLSLSHHQLLRIKSEHSEFCRIWKSLVNYSCPTKGNDVFRIEIFGLPHSECHFHEKLSKFCLWGLPFLKSSHITSGYVNVWFWPLLPWPCSLTDYSSHLG